MSRASDVYFQEASKAKPFPLPEQRKLLQLLTDLRAAIDHPRDVLQARKDKAAYTELTHTLAKSYLFFVVDRANRRSRRAQRMDREELFAELLAAGHEGLLIALQKFDAKYKVNFLTYGAPWVDVKMDEVFQRLGVVHMSVHARKQSIAQGVLPDDPHLSPIEDHEIEDHQQVAPDKRASGKSAYKCLHDAGLSLYERVLLTYRLGLRGTECDLEALARVLYACDGRFRSSTELARTEARALRTLKVFAEDAPYDVQDELS